MRELQRDRAVLLISHRFSSVRIAPTASTCWIMARSSSRARTSALMAAGGRYAEMFNLQAAAYLVDDGSAGDGS